jgi:hypothetical protein
MRCTALALLLALPFASQAESLGRLFFTPQQRAQLEYNHAHNATAEEVPSSVLTVDGVVQQHGGTRTVWINGKAQNSSHGGESVAEIVAVPGKSETIKIRVGQKLHLDTFAPQSAPVSAK